MSTNFDIPLSSRPTATVKVSSTLSGLSEGTIYKLIKEGKIRKYKVGRRTLIDVPSLLRAIGKEQPREAMSVDKASAIDLENR